MLYVDFEGHSNQGPVHIGRITWDGNQAHCEGDPSVQQALKGVALAEVGGRLQPIRFEQDPELFLRSLPTMYQASMMFAFVSEE